MKIFKKSVAILAIASMLVSSAVTAFAAFSEISVAQTATTVAAGESVAISATFDTLVGAKGMEIEFVYDDSAFAIDTTDNTDYNFGTNKKPVYYPNYVIEDVLSNYEEEMSIYNAWGSLSYNSYDDGVKFASTDTENGYVIEAGDEADDMYPYRTIGVNFTAKDDIADGTYTFTVVAKVSDSTSGLITSTKTTTVTVGGGETKEFDTANTTINSTGAVEGKYNGKILKHIATVLEKTALSKKISITNTTTNETRVSDRTIAQTLGGIGVDGATVTGDIAIGVLTDTDAVFTFSLVD